jgi:hypothetical protein
MKNFFTLLLLSTIYSVSFSQSFTVVDSVPEGAYGTAAWGDFNNDGFKDLVYISQVLPDAACKIYTFNGTSFSEITQQFPLLYNPGACWGDLNNDGFDDLVVNGMDNTFNGVTYIYQSVGNGTFLPVVNTIHGLSAGSVDIADYNNDGWKDIAVTGMDNLGVEQAYIYKNTGGFSFMDINAALYGIHFGEIKWGDMNNDGLKDLLINGIGTNDFRARIYKNMGQDSFLLQNIYMKGSGGTADWCDFDNDGWQDILITGYDSTSTINFTELHHNNQNGTFSVVASGLPDFGEPSAVDIADYNNDGKPDICFMGGSNVLTTGSALAFNLGNNQFQTQTFFNGFITNCIVAAADYDNDGDADLFFGERILRNDGITGINYPGNDGPVSLYPVPASDRISISAKEEIADVYIYNMTGEILMDMQPRAEKFHIDIEKLPQGNYFVEFISNDRTPSYHRLVIAR